MVFSASRVASINLAYLDKEKNNFKHKHSLTKDIMGNKIVIKVLLNFEQIYLISTVKGLRNDSQNDEKDYTNDTLMTFLDLSLSLTTIII